MTKEKSIEQLPGYITSTFNDVDWEVAKNLFTKEDTELLSQLTAHEWEYSYRKKAEKLRVVSPLVYWHSYIRFKDDESKAAAEGISKISSVPFLAEVTGGQLTKEQCIDAWAYAASLLITQPLKAAKLSDRTPFEQSLIAGFVFAEFLKEFDASEKSRDEIMRVYGDMLFTVLPKAIPTMFVGLIESPNRHLIPLMLIARVFAEVSKKGKGVYTWWRAVYRAFHDKHYTLAASEQHFQDYMRDNISAWEWLTKIFRVPEKLAETDYWFGTFEKTPLSQSGQSKGNGAKLCYTHIPCCQWQEQYLKLCDEDEDKMKEEFGSADLKDKSISIADKLTQWLEKLEVRIIP